LLKDWVGTGRDPITTFQLRPWRGYSVMAELLILMEFLQPALQIFSIFLLL
jgi:hypothetical protein